MLASRKMNAAQTMNIKLKYSKLSPKWNKNLKYLKLQNIKWPKQISEEQRRATPKEWTKHRAMYGGYDAYKIRQECAKHIQKHAADQNISRQ